MPALSWPQDESELAVLPQKYDRCLRSGTSKVCDVHNNENEKFDYIVYKYNMYQYAYVTMTKLLYVYICIITVHYVTHFCIYTMICISI